MKNSVASNVLGAVLVGVAAVVVSLPILFLVHRALGLGNPPITGLVILGGTVVICFALGGGVGASIGAARGNSLIAALLGLVIGGAACFIVAPFYGSLVVEGLSRDATGLVLSERSRFENAAKNAGSDTLAAAREGRLREQLAQYKEQAAKATTPEARANAAERARELGSQLATEGKTKGLALLKSGAARASSFSLLLWAIVVTPLVAAFACRQARR